MQAARLWLRVFLLCSAATGLLLIWTLVTPPFYGDLTRVGLLSEREFGWREPQPAIDVKLLRSWPVTEANVLVIGDSFSQELVWQSVLVHAGFRVATVSWHQTGPLCSDFSAWLSRIGFRGEHVIIESVERELDTHLQASAACHTMTKRAPHPRAPASPSTAPPTLPPAFALNTREALFTGINTALNTARAERATAGGLYGGALSTERTRVAPVPNGCAYFSHRACTKGLFLSGDFERAQVSQETVRRMVTFTRAQPRGVRIRWMVLPNKSTIYLEAERALSFGAALDRETLGPDFFTLLAHARATTRDTYAPNDTHLSSAGYLLVGQRMLADMRAAH